MADAAERLADIRARIAKAAQLARRSPDDITLIAVTKGREMSAIEPLIAAGQRDFGENYVQELVDKATQVCRYMCFGSMSRRASRFPRSSRKTSDGISSAHSSPTRRRF